ncbi:MAG: hypothetical protein B7X95_02680 [Methylophilaceae bacterium 17-44-8]|jgi:MSHA biogenesis protein MshN|nr:MAG: hypothetical protein B7Y48_00895 [Methylophilales bacterium 28-44-11]OYZ03616.1 MAG: hypothetical protein B7Y32_04690 [Methylophilales bacterium 16-45-7]OZA06442.1 MAG: hypothetical protein B7X95_02680 [Methylophilaceae bacterium 17-44-8]
MSLINQMLQELEQRKASASPQSHPELKPTALAVQALVTPRKSKVLQYALLAALCAAGAYGMQWISHPAMPELQQSASLPATTGVITEANANTKPMAVDVLTVQASAPVVVEQNEMLQSPLLFAPTLDKKLHIAQSNSALATAHNAQKSNTIALESNGKNNALPMMVAAVALTKQSASNAVSDTPDASLVALANTHVPSKAPSTRSAEPKVNVNKTMSPEQKATHMYQQAIAYLQQGRVAEAQDQLKTTIDAYPHHDDARQTLVGLLVDNKRHDEAMQVLKTGLKLTPNHTGYAQALARLQLDAGMLDQALATLESHRGGASQPQEYHALMAILLQKLGQHGPAITYYQQALSQGVSAPAWLIGLGVSLQAEGRALEAKQAYQQAQSSQLSPELALFVSQRLKQVQ